MLNFKTTSVVFALLLGLMVRLQLQHGLPWYAWVLLPVAYSLVVFYGCYYIGSDFFIKIICRGKTTERSIAISFDDGPSPGITPRILQALEQSQVPATFFCIGKHIAGNEQLLRDIHAAGHLVGNHSFSHHFWFDLFSSKKMLEDLEQMDQSIREATGLQPKWFRPPYGVTNPNLAKAIRAGGYTPVGWSVRSLDTVIKDRGRLLEKLARGLRPGAIFLFHDTQPITADILPEFLEQVKKAGYRVVGLDYLLHLKAYA